MHSRHIRGMDLHGEMCASEVRMVTMVGTLMEWMRGIINLTHLKSPTGLNTAKGDPVCTAGIAGVWIFTAKCAQVKSAW
jgi:hypothetical protein